MPGARSIAPGAVATLFIPRFKCSRAPCSSDELPPYFLSAAEWNEPIAAEGNLGGSAPHFFDERDRAGIARQAIERRAEMTGETLQSLQRTCRGESFRIEFDTGMGGVDAGASAIGLLGVARVRCAVGAQEELRITAHCRFDQR